MPQRGQISWFEIVLFTSCVIWVAFGLAPALQDVVVLSFLFAGPLAKYKGTPVNLLAKAMIKLANDDKPGVRIIENEQIFVVAEK